MLPSTNQIRLNLHQELNKTLTMKEIWLLIQKENEQLICPKSIYKSTNQKKSFLFFLWQMCASESQAHILFVFLFILNLTSLQTLQLCSI